MSPSKCFDEFNNISIHLLLASSVISMSDKVVKGVVHMQADLEETVDIQEEILLFL